MDVVAVLIAGAGYPPPDRSERVMARSRPPVAGDLSALAEMLQVAAAVQVEPLQIAPAIGFGVLYLVRARTLAQQGRPVPRWRQWCWYCGLAIIVVALVSPLGALADELFLAHMAEHLLIADLGALLLVLGLTGPLLAPLLRLPRARAGCAPSRTPSRRSRCGPATCCSGTSSARTRRPCATRPCTRCSTCSSSGSGSTCGWRCSARCPSPRGSATQRSSATSSPCA